MEKEFWLEVWDEGSIGFHQKDFNRKMLEFFPALGPQAGQKVLVPLCGKSKDLLRLESQGLDVHGVELASLAVKQFFEENASVEPKATRDRDFTHLELGRIRISCGDFFKLGANEAYDFVYDRAALVALPENMRAVYAEVVKRALKKGGKCLLLTYEYAPGDLEGPPFSVDAREVERLYGDCCRITQLELQHPEERSPRLVDVKSIRLGVYLLEKVS